jgi:hypothetical protein
MAAALVAVTVEVPLVAQTELAVLRALWMSSVTVAQVQVAQLVETTWV